MEKHIIICADGTWNRPEEDIETDVPTNVLRVVRAIRPWKSNDHSQHVFYDWGVGSYYAKITGGITEQNTRLYDHPRIGGDEFRAYNEERFVRESLKLIEPALALDEREAAEAVRDRALEWLPDERLRQAIAQSPANGEEEPSKQSKSAEDSDG